MAASKHDLHEWADVAERNVLVLNYTMTCPLSCSFCCYGCHPRRTEKMPLDRAKRLISEAAGIEAFSSVGFTGGEVFAYEDDLLELADHLATVGLPFTVATAGHWGRSKRHADDLAKALVRRGLRRANISYDTAHAEFIPAESVVNAALAMADQRIPVYVVGTFADPSQTVASLLPALTEHKGIKLINKRIARVGRAKKSDMPYMRNDNYSGTCYRRFYHELVVFWDGKAYPCCSTFNRSTKGLCIGNAFDEGLTAVWKKIDNWPLLSLLKRRGFGELYDIARKYKPELLEFLPPLDGYEGPCSLCNAVFARDEIRDGLEAIADELFVDELLASYEQVRERLHGASLRGPSSVGSSATGRAGHGYGREELKKKLQSDPAVREKFFNSFKEMVRAAGLDPNDSKVMSDLGFKSLNPRDAEFATQAESTVVITITK